MNDITSIKNKDYTAVFINENNSIPYKVTSLGIYKIIGGLCELCEYEYWLEGFASYKILEWETREAKDNSCYNLMANIIDQQKGFKNLIKE